MDEEIFLKKNSQKIRPSWDEIFMFNAYWISTRSSCLHLQTGAVLVKDKRIIATGYNGAPPGIKNCLEVGCRKERENIKFEEKDKRVCRGIHAEMNAINQISREGLKGTSLYTVYYPCSSCAKNIVGVGIQELIYSKIYEEPDSLTNELFLEAKIKIRKLELNLEKIFDIIRKNNN
jgi:dCMP deaminase